MNTLHKALGFTSELPSYFWVIERLSIVAYGVSVAVLLTQFLRKKRKYFTLKKTISDISLLLLQVLLPLFTSYLIVDFGNGTVFYYCIAILVLGIGSSIQLLYDRDLSGDHIIRGEKLLSHHEAKKLSAKLTKNQQAPSFFWCGVHLPFEDEVKNLLIVGEPGSGKSKSIQLLMESTLPFIGHGYNQRAVIYDPKRNTVSQLKGMNPG
jgi:hypothetical protein